LKEGKLHPIIDRPFEYKVIGLNYKKNSDDHLRSYIDLKLQKGDIIRNLRFYGPQDLEIEKGFPEPTSGMEILDVSERQLENINVRVTDFEASPGKITFWAKSVIDLDLENE